MTATDQTPQPPARPEPRLSGPDICQVPGEDGSPVCVRTMEQRPCRTCPAYPEPPAAPADADWIGTETIKGSTPPWRKEPPATPAQSAAEPPAAADPHPDSGPGWKRHVIEATTHTDTTEET